MGAINEGEVLGIITEGETVGAVNEGEALGIITKGETVGANKVVGIITEGGFLVLYF